MKVIVTAHLYVEEEALLAKTAEEIVAEAGEAGDYLTQEKAQYILDKVLEAKNKREEAQARKEAEKAEREQKREQKRKAHIR